MRRIISYTILNNEADIIEAFVRYNMCYIDKMIIIDNGCTDATIDILRLLMNEGYDIDIYDESLIDFEQYRIMNYYLRLLSERYKSDIIIPLDSDEFLMSDTGNVRNILEKLSLEVVYRLRWRTFVMDKRNDLSDNFVCRQMKYSYLHKDCKVIIPTDLIKKYDVILEVGQHDVSGKIGLQCENAKELQMAHYPNRGLKQFCAKSMCHSIRNINYFNRQNNEGIHRNLFANHCMNHIDDDNCQWIDEIIQERMKEYSADEVMFHPVNLTEMGLDGVQMKYTDLARIDVLKNIYSLAQVMAVKAYNAEIEKNFSKNRPTILIYGTGKTALDMFRGHPIDLVNVRAYINSNPNIEFSMFEHRLVITTRVLKFFKYDKILIASRKFYEEINNILKDAGVPDDKIVGIEYLLKLSIERLKPDKKI